MQDLRLEQLTLGGLLDARTSLETDPNLFLSHTHLPYSGGWAWGVTCSPPSHTLFLTGMDRTIALTLVSQL